jgi:hypothetical protein
MEDYENDDNQIVAEYNVYSYFDIPEEDAENLSKAYKWFVKWDTLNIQAVEGGEWEEYTGSTEHFDFKRTHNIYQGDRILESGDDFKEIKTVPLSDREYELRFASSVSETNKDSDREELILLESQLKAMLGQVKNNQRLSDRNIDAIEKVLFNVNNALGVVEYPK